MKILRCDLCNATKEIAASTDDRIEFFWIDVKEYDGHSTGDQALTHAHMCPECYMKIKEKIRTEEATS